jgi:hypothetical protein
MAAPGKYPLALTRVAEAVVTDLVRREATPLAPIAERDGWFAGQPIP